MTKAEKIAAFNPNAAGQLDSDLFGLPFTPEEAEVVIVPVPWEVTVSYGSGASQGPGHVREASMQVDLYHPEYPDLWKAGIATDEVHAELTGSGERLRMLATGIIDQIGETGAVPSDPAFLKNLDEVNEGCRRMNRAVQTAVSGWLDKGKLVGLLGGDHSTPLGYFRAQASRHDEFGILHLDAHMDLRRAFEGFEYSHASVMYNALQIPQMKKLVQVGIRDYCEEEQHRAAESDGRVKVFTERSMRRDQFRGTTWHRICQHIIDSLPEKVHISFDIDGLDPTLCPGTGTPVPGGLSFEEAAWLLSEVAEQRTVIGFDLVEVAPGEGDWNGNVGARMLFHLCGVLGRSNRRC